jgi:Polysaccharide deacetylase
MCAFFRLLVSHPSILCGSLFTATLLLQGCGSVQPVAARPSGASANPPAGFFLPAGTFGNSGNDAKPQSAAPITVAAASEPPAPTAPAASRAVITPQASKPAPPPPVPVPVPLTVPAGSIPPVVTVAPVQVARTAVSPAPQAPLRTQAAEPSLSSYLCLIFSKLDGCAGPRPLTANGSVNTALNPPPGFFLPLGTFGNAVSDAKPAASTPVLANASSSAGAPAATSVALGSQTPAGDLKKPVVPSPPVPLVAPVTARSQPASQAAITLFSTPASTSATPSASLEPQVVVYASPATKAYFSKTGIDGSINAQVWSIFLGKYQIPFQIVTAVDKLEATSANVLVLPSSVALSEREKQAIVSFRAKGGSVLASWLTGARDENGTESGHGFMEKALDVKVVGTTEADAKDNFMLPHGDSPVTHFLPAGTRIWLDRVKGLYPLRLQGRHPAADIMDWSRVPILGKESTTIVFDERVQASGRASRSVVLGYPEQLWLSADPRQLEAIAHNAVMWLLRQPAIYKAAWPYPYGSAMVMAIDTADVVTDADLANAKLLEDAGLRATYYVLSENVVKSANRLRRLKSAGHEIAYLGDSFNDFREQAPELQAKRLDGMRQTFATAELDLPPDVGFHAPMDSYDKNTQNLLKQRTFGYFLATMDVSEARLPFLATREASPDPAKPVKDMVILPRTQDGPEASVDNCAPEIGIKAFLNELNLAHQMAGLLVVALPAKNELTDSQTADIFKDLSTRREKMWMATSQQVADWWRERERVAVQLESGDAAPVFTVTIAAGPPLLKAAAAFLNLPGRGVGVRLVARGSQEKPTRIVAVDAWRAALVLEGWQAGQYKWDVYFEPPGAASAR